MQRLAAVDHDDGRLRLEALPDDLVGAASSPPSALGNQLGEVDELDAIAERVGVEERERLEVAHELVVRLRPRRVVERPALRPSRSRSRSAARGSSSPLPGRAARSRSASRPGARRRERGRGRSRRSTAAPSRVPSSNSSRTRRHVHAGSKRLPDEHVGRRPRSREPVARADEEQRDLGGRAGCGEAARSARRRSSRGIMKSVVTRSGLEPPSSNSSASRPCLASWTWCPAISRVVRITNRMFGSSSTTRMFDTCFVSPSPARLASEFYPTRGRLSRFCRSLRREGRQSCRRCTPYDNHFLPLARTHRRQRQPSLPRRDDVRRVGQHRPRRVDSRHPPRARRRHQLRRHRRRLRARRVRGDRRQGAQGPPRLGRPRDEGARRRCTTPIRTCAATRAGGSCRRSRQACAACRPTGSTSTRSTAGIRGPTHDETLGALTDLQRAGKIRYFGSSTYPPSEIVEAQWVAEKRSLARFVVRAAAVLDPRPRHRGGGAADLRALRHGRDPVEPARGRLALGPVPQGRRRRRATAQQRIPARYDLSIPGNQQKLEAVEQLAQLAEGAG